MSQKFSLFRAEAQQAQRTQTLGPILLVRPISLSLLTAAALAMGLGVVLLFSLGSYTRRIEVSGQLVPDTGLVKVYVPQAGIVLKKFVKEGQHVERNQKLYTVSSDRQSNGEGHVQAAISLQAEQRQQSLRDEIGKTRQLQQNERKMLEDRARNLRAQLSGIDNQLASQRDRAALAADAVTRYQGLLAQDYISKDQLQQRQAEQLDERMKQQGLERDRASAAQALAEALGDLAGLALKQQNQLSSIDRDLLNADRELVESEGRRQTTITAPEAGIVTALLAQAGQTVDSARPLASIVPSSALLQAHLYAPSSAIGFVRQDNTVLLRYQPYPYQKFGQYRGRVVSVARTALPAAEYASASGAMPASADSNGALYRITVELDAQSITAYGKPQPLQAGMLLQADILQERRRLYEWVLEPLYSLTGRL